MTEQLFQCARCDREFAQDPARVLTTDTWRRPDDLVVTMAPVFCSQDCLDAHSESAAPEGWWD